MKHTKGPWYTKGKSINIADQHIVYNEETGRDIAICYGVGSPGEAEANAHLIAAAPELLKALKDVVEFVDDHGDWTGYPAFKQAYDAINKAEGKN